MTYSLIKVGKGVDEYRSLVKSLLSPAGTIFFGEVSIRNEIDARADIYNVDFDGSRTTRSFIPTLIIGSKIDAADIQLEVGTYYYILELKGYDKKYNGHVVIKR